MDRRPGWYTWLALLAVAVASPVLSLWLGLQLAQRSQCGVYRAQLAVYREVPPTTATGVALKKTYEEKIQSDCGGKA